MNYKHKIILTTELCRIIQETNQIKVFIKLSEGGWLEHNAFTADTRGLLGALTLAVDVTAGKFWPAKIVTDENRFINEGMVLLPKKGGVN